MMEVTYDKVAYFYDRTIAHIKCVLLIQEYVNKQFGSQFKVNYWHDATKFYRDSLMGYFYITFKYLGEKLTRDEDQRCKDAWKNHYTTEAHHPEFYTSFGSLESMDKQKIFEMCCDWLAMSYEFKEEDWTNFWRETASNKYSWTNEQRERIERILNYANMYKNEIVEMLDEKVTFPKWK